MKDLIYSNCVRELRKEKDVSQTEMARDLDISRRTISLVENQEQNVSLEIAYRISAYFGKMVTEVFPMRKVGVLSSGEIRS